MGTEAERVTPECCQCTERGDYASAHWAYGDGWLILDSGEWVCPFCTETDEEEEEEPGFRWGWNEGAEY